MPGQPALNVVPEPPEPLGADILEKWALDPAITYLNHGHFGACPRAVLEAQSAWRERLEARPIEFLERQRRTLLAHARQAVGGLIGADLDDFGFVTNATGGVNAVLRSLKFQSGDELVTTNHVYNAVRQTLHLLARTVGATVVEVDVPLPVKGPDEIVRAIAGALTDRTRLVVIDHITSSTAVILPVRRIVDVCGDRGIDVLVDGAHAPGMVDLDVTALGAAYYAGNLHKWVCAPKGAAFLWVRPDRQAGIHPNTISHYLDQGLAEEFQWQGTRDITAWLCARDSIEFMGQFGWDNVRRHNHALAVWAQAAISSRWRVPVTTPVDGSMLGSMASIPVPGEVRSRLPDARALQSLLLDEYSIEIPVIEWGDQWWVRVSCQVYNEPQQYDRLAEAVMEHVR